MRVSKSRLWDNGNQKHLIKREVLIGDFYRVVHDIKAPIASLIGLVSLTKSIVKGKPAKAYLTDIERHFRMLEKDLFASLNEGLKLMDCSQDKFVDFKKVVGEVIQLFAFSPGAETVYFRTFIKQNRKFRANRLLIFSVLQNIVDNAIRHGRDSMQKELTITINITQQKSAFKIVVQDDGKGITRIEKLNGTKDEFSSKAVKHGNGLGFYIIEKSIKKLNGTLVVVNRPGHGVKYVICIPEVSETEV
jgi:signal transduction histidine kinase